ncbi:MAG TPA: hypothetical protein VLR49_12655, partial [Ferruginibacter sp.]|nr:hypothetical protein [Ferruginibacter sp.]
FNDIYGKTAPEAAEPAKKTRRSGAAKKKADGTEEIATAEVVSTEVKVPKKKAAKAENAAAKPADETTEAPKDATDETSSEKEA